MVRTADNATDQRLRALEHACRGVVGDRLRSVSVDSPELSRTLYRRRDLAPDADESVREAMAAGASCRSPVFTDGGRPSPSCVETDDDRPSSSSVATDDDRPSSSSVATDDARPSPSSDPTDDARPSPSSVGPPSSRTVCEFENGFVTRIQFGRTTVVATTGGLKMDRETELSAAVRGVLEA